MHPFQGLRVLEVGFAWESPRRPSQLHWSCGLLLCCKIRCDAEGCGQVDLVGESGLETWERSNKKEWKPQKFEGQGVLEKIMQNPHLLQEHTSPVRLVGFAAPNGQTKMITAIARRPTGVLRIPYIPIEDMRPCSGTFCGS